ncbi:MAG: DNA primase [Candidatus Cloacimonadales bacterium]
MESSQIDQIRERNNIVDVIGSYFPLKKTGSNYKARCPFHDEKTASFVVSEKKQIYKCFGCGAAGNVISFVMEYEKVSFMEAMKKLAARVGVSIEDSRKIPNKKENSKRDLIYKVYELSAYHFQTNLKKYGKVAENYLLQRQISQATIDKFMLGYALDSFGSLKNYLIKQNINEQILPLTGLFGKSDKGSYDLFRQRLMFPIHDVHGKVVAFGGRVLEKNQGGGKYVNSPTTEIYLKGNELYGLFQTRHAINRKDFSLICEGYTDFLRLYEQGFENVVASLGTALTEKQVRLLGRFSNNFYLLYDGDKAGKKAAVRAAANVIKEGFTARVVTLPDNEDPDSFLLKNQPEKLQKLIEQAQTLPNFLYNDQLLEMEDRSKLNNLIEISQDIDDEVALEFFVKEVSEIFQVSQQAIFSQMRNQSGRKLERQNNKLELRKYTEERDLLKIILHENNYKKFAQLVDSTYFLSDLYKEIFTLIEKNSDKLSDVAALLDLTENKAAQKIIAELIMEDAPSASLEQVLVDLEVRRYELELDEVVQKLMRSPEPQLIQKKVELKRKISALSGKVVKKTLFRGV